MQGEEKMGTSYRHEEHGEEVNHGFHVETPLGRDADGGEEDQGAEGGQKELGHQRTHGCSREQGVCEQGRNGGGRSRGEGALKFKCPAWQEGCGQGTAATGTAAASAPGSSRIPDTAGSSGQQMLCAPKIVLGVSKGVKDNVALGCWVWVRGGEDSGFARSSWGYPSPASRCPRAQPGSALLEQSSRENPLSFLTKWRGRH